MRRRSITAVAVLVSLAALLALSLTAFRSVDVRTGSPHAMSLAPPRVEYAALGDSYSAGVGAGAPTGNDGSCARSRNAYPPLWAAVNHTDRFTFLACSGAKVDDVLTQVSAMPASTTLVSLTAGGNDVGFSEVMLSCTLLEVLRCADAIDKAVGAVHHQLPGLLDRLYSAVSTRAPKARVIVLGYPHFYDVKAAPCPGVFDANRSKINAGIDTLDQAIATVAARHSFVFSDPRAAFNGHELCSGRTWLHAIDVSDLSQSYHPTADGQRSGYLPTFTASARK